MTRFVSVSRIMPNRRVELMEKDSRNYTVGEWIGYWNSERGSFNLYPNKRKKAFWPEGKIPEGKRVVSDRLVYIRYKDYTERPLRRAV